MPLQRRVALWWAIASMAVPAVTTDELWADEEFKAMWKRLTNRRIDDPYFGSLTSECQSLMACEQVSACTLLSYNFSA